MVKATLLSKYSSIARCVFEAIWPGFNVKFLAMDQVCGKAAMTYVFDASYPEVAALPETTGEPWQFVMTPSATGQTSLAGSERTVWLGVTSNSRRGERCNAFQEFSSVLFSMLAIAGCALSTSTHAASERAVVVVAAFGANDAAAALSRLTEGARVNAIASMVRSGQLRGPLSASDGVLLLNGTSQSVRAASIGELAQLFKADLTGQEAAALLGPSNNLNEGNRYNAVAALARAKRFGPSLGGDAGLVLDGTTQSTRAAAIGEIAPYVRTDLRGQQVAAILGSGQILGEGNRYNAIAALARANRVPQALTAAEALPILAGTTRGVRAAAIAELARFFAEALSGEDAAAILGRNGETTEGDRLNALAALARAGKLRPGLSGQEMMLVLDGMSGQARAAAIGEITAAAARRAADPPSTRAAQNPSPAGSKAPAAPGSTEPFGSGTSPQAIPTTTAGSTPVTSAPAKPLPKLVGSDLTDTARAYEFALLADAVYSGRSPVELQTRSGKISWRQWDRQIQDYPGTNFSLGFKASTYLRRSNVAGEWLCAVVFAGTDGPEPVDWANNILQAAGALVPEYEQGAIYAKKITSGICKNRKVTFVGHSLGGGIAQYAFVRTGGVHQARTFNSAGLSWLKSPEWEPYVSTTQVINFVAQPFDAADGEPLVGHEPVSVTGELIGKRILVPAYGYRATHFMSVIQEGVGIQRDYCLADGGCN